MDRIVVLEEGRIIEQGTHQHLLDQKANITQCGSIKEEIFLLINEVSLHIAPSVNNDLPKSAKLTEPAYCGGMGGIGYL